MSHQDRSKLSRRQREELERYEQKLAALRRRDFVQTVARMTPRELMTGVSLSIATDDRIAGA